MSKPEIYSRTGQPRVDLAKLSDTEGVPFPGLSVPEDILTRPARTFDSDTTPMGERVLRVEEGLVAQIRARGVAVLEMHEGSVQPDKQANLAFLAGLGERSVLAVGFYDPGSKSMQAAFAVLNAGTRYGVVRQQADGTQTRTPDIVQMAYIGGRNNKGLWVP
ncbi:MAG: hypothetical protein HYV40_04475 [Candidatus Levybacteria bacterium]|nr:hypothetical protein [Candidatus Levybacteria bacterium]